VGFFLFFRHEASVIGGFPLLFAVCPLHSFEVILPVQLATSQKFADKKN
jgi:hypothetical protein